MKTGLVLTRDCSPPRSDVASYEDKLIKDIGSDLGIPYVLNSTKAS